MRIPLIKPAYAKGYMFAFLATIAGSTVYIFSKAALDQVSLPQFGVWWFSFALLWNLAFVAITTEPLFTVSISGSVIKALGRIGIYELVATTCFYAAIATASHPAIPSFLRNSEYLFVTLLGVSVLKERFAKSEIMGIALVFLGVLIISFQKGGSFSAYFHGSSGLMLVATVFYALRTLAAKKHITQVTPSALAINRAVFLWAFAVIALLFMGQTILIPLPVILLIGIGSFLGPFLTSIGQYSALKYFEASRTAIIQSTTALFVLPSAYFYFGKLPLGYQLIGGLFTIVGTVVLVLSKKS
jgi:drug/metabolite transporter (DMT)-like permease